MKIFIGTSHCFFSSRLKRPYNVIKISKQPFVLSVFLFLGLQYEMEFPNILTCKVQSVSLKITSFFSALEYFDNNLA